MPLLSLFNVKDTTLSDPYQQRLWNFPVDVSIQVWLVKVGHRKPKIWIGLGSCMVNYFPHLAPSSLDPSCVFY